MQNDYANQQAVSNTNVGLSLRENRKAAGLTMEMVCAKMRGMDTLMLSRIERGEVDVSAALYVQLHNIYSQPRGSLGCEPEGLAQQAMKLVNRIESDMRQLKTILGAITDAP